MAEDWAETRAREWLAPVASLDQVHSLAALLRGVAGQGCPHCGRYGWYLIPDPRTGEAMQEQCSCARRVSLAEVRRVVGEIRTERRASAAWRACCNEILSRLEKL